MRGPLAEGLTGRGRRRGGGVSVSCFGVRRFDALVDEAGLDVELARGWTLLRAADYQLWGLNLGLTDDPELCSTVIDWLSLADRL